VTAQPDLGSTNINKVIHILRSMSWPNCFPSPPPTPPPESPDLRYDRHDTSWQPSESPTGSQNSNTESSSSRDSLSAETVVSDTTSSWSPSPRRRLYDRLNQLLESPQPISNQQDQLLQTTMFGRRTPELANHFNLDLNPFKETQKQTGIEFVISHLPDKWMMSPVKYTFDITATFKEFEWTRFNLFPWNDLQPYSGVLLEPANPDEPGKKPEDPLTAKIHVQSFGVAIMVSKTLSSMNFEEQSIYPTYSDGWIVILSGWKLKEALFPWRPQSSG